jgi:hypothetical protein
MARDTSDLDYWRTFPHDISPRPIVLLDRKVKTILGDGWSAGHRPGVLTDDGAPRIAEEAIDISYPFLTDRGLTELPAQVVQLEGDEQHYAVLSNDVPIWWPTDRAEVNPALVMSARIGPDGKHVTMRMWASAKQQLPASLTFTEYASCVVVAPLLLRDETDRRPARAYRRARWISGVLHAPLGGRVLIDPAQTPAVVTLATTHNGAAGRSAMAVRPASEPQRH